METNKQRNIFKFLIFIIALGLIWYSGRLLRIDTQPIEHSLKGFPVIYSGLIFVVLYVVVTFFVWLSKDLFRLTAAILFGSYLSTLFIWIAETANAFILFHLARYLGRGFVESSLKADKRGLDSKLANVNFFWIFMFRFAPLVPFRFLDLGMGLTSISFRKYLLAVILGSPVRIFWQQYVLCAVGRSILTNPAELTGYFLQNKTLFVLSLIYVLSVILVALKIKFKGRSRCL